MSLVARKTMQSYLFSADPQANDVAVSLGDSYITSQPYVIAMDKNDIVPLGPAANQEMSFGEIPYTIETTQTCQVHLNVPINSYACEQEFAPQLSLDYNSGRNSFDVLGKGWILKGIPVISRVSKDFFTDGNVEGISLTDNHSFALDGERLIFQSESTDTVRFIGQTSNTKATLIKSDNKFVVHYPDGSVANMSGTDSINYCITKLTQKDGQKITYSYADPFACGNGHKYTSSISYGDKRIDFVYYSTNDDRIDFYRVGKQFKLRTKLKQINIYEQDSLITRYQLTSYSKTDSPLQEITQFFDGDKHYHPLKLSYLYQGELDQVTSDSTRLSWWLNDLNPSECIIQRGKFSSYSEGEGFLMYKNKDSYYLDSLDNKYKTGYGSSGIILVAHNSEGVVGHVPSSILYMENGFVDAFTVNADSVKDEEIVTISDRISNNNTEQIKVDIYGVHYLFGMGLKKTFYLQSNNVSLMPKTFLTGDFDGDGFNEMVMVEYNSSCSSCNTSFKMIDLNTGQSKIDGEFDEHLNVLFPVKNAWNQQLSPEYRWNNYKQSDKIFTIDYNGDGKQEIGIVNNDGFKIYEFYKNSSGNVASRTVSSNIFPSLDDLRGYAMRIGELNGDGIADILFYLETDTIHSNTQKRLFKTFLGRGDGTFEHKSSIVINYNSIIPIDVTLLTNRNGITDIISRGKKIASADFKLMIIKMRNGMFERTDYSLFPDSAALVPAYFYGECSNGGVLAVGSGGILLTYREVRPIDTSWKLSRLTDSYRNNYTISYRRIYESDSYHPDFGRYQFPYSTFAKGQLVCHTISKYDNNNNLIQDKYFDYGNAVMHEQGLGQLGFDNIAVIDSVTGRTQSYSYDILKMGAPTRKENYKSINIYSHELNITSDKRLQLRMTGMSHFDKATSCSDTTSYTHDLYGNVTQAFTAFPGGETRNTGTQYLNIDEDNKNIIGLPLKVTYTVTNANGSAVGGLQYSYNDSHIPTSERQFFGNDSQVLSERQFVYDSQNRIVEEKEKNFNSSWLSSYFDYTGNKRKPSQVTDKRGVGYDMIYTKFGNVKRKHELPVATAIDPMISGGSMNGGDNINGGGGGGSVVIDLPTPLPLSAVTTYDYDEAGNVTCTSYPTGTKHTTHRTWVYNSLGYAQSFFVTDSVTGQPVTRTYYNCLGQKTRVETQRPDNSFLKVDYEYDALGRLVKQYEPYKTNRTLFTSFAYDDYDRLVSKTYPDGHSDTFSYCGLTTSSNVGGVASSRTVDGLGNLVSVTDPGGTITYSMTADGRPLSINVNGEASTTFEYDTYGRKTALNDPSSGHTAYTYDAAGNIATVTDARGKTITTTYNDYGMPLTKSLGGDMTVSYSYDVYLQPTAVTCSNGNSKQYTFNDEHQLTSETVNGFKKTYSYSGDNVARIAYSLNGTSLGSESYDRTCGTVTAINYGGKTLWRLEEEDGHAMPTTISSSVVSSELDYDDLHRVTSRTAETSASGTFLDMQYEYDSHGNMTSREDGYWCIAEEFGYDNLNRLVSTADGDITYDGKGDITGHDAAGVFGYASSRPYALDQITLSVSDFPTASQAVAYNSMSRPDTISEGSTTARLNYFEDGERSQMTVTGSNSYKVYKYFGNQLTTVDITAQGQEGQRQVLFLGGDAYTAPAAIIRTRETGMSNWSQSLYYIVRDNLGSITHVVDSTGVVAQELSYDAWGRLRDPVTQLPYAPGDQPEPLLGRGYCGHEHLGAFSLVNMNARLYDPWAARFLSPDPYVQFPDFTQSLNRYSYCLNNPLRLVDPEGENPVYNKNGHFIGLTQEGFTGDIIICTAPGKYKFSDYTADQLLNENDVYTMDDCMKSDLSDPNHLTGWAMSNIWTDVIGYYYNIGHKITLNGESTGVSFSLLFLSYKSILFRNMTFSDSGWETNYITGEIFSDGNYVNYYESTVENIANSIIYHEWYGHLMNWFKNNLHYRAFECQMQSPFWDKTTSNYKNHIIGLYKSLKKQ